jgi:hypothetical protein
MRAARPDRSHHVATPRVSFNRWFYELREHADPRYIERIDSIGWDSMKLFWLEGCEPTVHAIVKHCKGPSPRARLTASYPGYQSVIES